MAGFSASEVAMTGFGLVARRPAALIWWIGLHLVFIGALSLILVTVGGPAMTQMMALQGQGAPADPQTQAQMLALFGQIMPVYLLISPLTLALYAVFFAAMNRAVLRPEKSAFGYLRLGSDEWRQFLLFLWAGVLGIGLELVLIVAGVVIAIIVAIAFAAMNKGAQGAGAGMAAAAWAPAILGLLVVLSYIYVMVRLSLASAMTFDTGKVSLLKSWRLTKGRFWSMFGAYALAVFLSIVVSLLGLVIMIACVMLMGGVGGLGFIFRPDMSSPAVYFTPVRLVYLALSGVLYALVWPVLLTPSAAIYKAVTSRPEPKPASWPSPSPPLGPPGSEPSPFCALPDAPKPL